MSCLEKTDLIFYILNNFQLATQHQETEQHLKTCPDCRHRINELKLEIEKMQYANSEACEMVQNSLLDYTEDRLPEPASLNIKAHIDECEKCDYVYRLIEQKNSFEDVQAFDIPVPQRLTDNIKRILIKSTSDLKPIDYGKIASSISSKAHDVIEKFVLTLHPSPKLAFLGGEIHGEAVVEFKGHDVSIDIKSSGQAVKIFSLDKNELACELSNEKGVVTFKDFLPGKYKIMVEGFAIEDVQVIRD